MKKIEDLTGRKYGRLTVIRYLWKRHDGHHIWECRCSCGITKAISRNRLTSTKEPTRSCGCRQLDIAHQINRKHGMSHTPVYKVWTSIKQRCLNKNNPEYHNYGARGITICSSWLKFENFYADMGDPPPKSSIERKDNSKGYDVSNCIWATMKIQQRNKRTNRYVTYKGATKVLKDWCDELGLNYSVALYRHKKNMPVEKILEKHTPRRRGLAYKGVTKSIAQWAADNKMGRATLQYRISKGWSVERALKTPVR